MSAPEVSYADGSGVEIAYQVLGEGPPDVVWVAGAITHLGVLWEHAGYRRFCEQLASFSRLILFDKRGMGLSERVRDRHARGADGGRAGRDGRRRLRAAPR